MYRKTRRKDTNAINLISPPYSGKLKLSMELNIFKLMDAYVALVF